MGGGADSNMLTVKGSAVQKQSPRGVLSNFAKFTGKHKCQSPLFNKVVGRPATLLKKRLWHRCFPVNFAKFLRTPFVIEHLRWLFLSVKLIFLEDIRSCCWIIRKLS